MQICRTLGTAQLRNLDPFLMLDEMRLPARAAFKGFPDHPHRYSAMRRRKASSAMRRGCRLAHVNTLSLYTKSLLHDKPCAMAMQ